MRRDDFTISGPESELRWVADLFIMEPAPHVVKKMTILNRIVGRKDDWTSLEADPKHVDLILEDND